MSNNEQQGIAETDSFISTKLSNSSNLTARTLIVIQD